MDLLLKNVTIVDSKSSLNFQKRDILIVNGIIKKISKKIKINDINTIEKENLHVSNGWFDSSVCFGEPGYEERETIENGLNTAALSGFTGVSLNPNTNPFSDSIASISHLINSSINHPTKIHPISCLTINQEGKKMCELFDLHNHGAIGHFDYKIPIKDSGLLETALKYSQRFDGIIFSFPHDNTFNGNNSINESKSSSKIGIKGIPRISEIIQVKRDLEILKYTGGKLFIPYITCKESVELIKNAKDEGLNIKCSTPIMHLVYDDSEIENFNENYKFIPPLRSKDDINFLKSGIIDGTIDMVCSMHEPINSELKDIEFINSAPGSISLEATFGILSKIFPLEKVIELLTKGYEYFLKKKNSINENNVANLTLFFPDIESEFNESKILSKSKNCVFLNRKINGEVHGIINDKKILIKS